VIVTNMAKNKQKDTCLACNKAFTKSDASIQCVMCGLWIHHKPCSLVSDDGFQFLSEQLQATGYAYWGCRPCVSYSQAITKKVREVEKKLDEVQKEVKDNAKAIDKVDKNVEDIRKELDKMKEKSSVEMDGFMTAEEYREREARKVNLIMHRVRESEAASAELRREADTLECGKIFRAAGVSEQDSEIKACRRLGEKGNDPRPLVVVMRKETARAAILDAARQLKNTDYSDVSIVPDLTPLQRKEETSLADEAERRNRDELSEDDVQKNLKWYVVGVRGARRLVKTRARAETSGRGRGRRPSGPARPPRQSGPPRPAVPQPTGRQPSLSGPELLPSRKRNREWRAAAHRDGQEDDEMEEEGEEEEEGTRSPASKK
jgi:hypothetical protein